MISFIANVNKANSAYGLYGYVNSKALAPFIGKKCKITVTEVKD